MDGYKTPAGGGRSVLVRPCLGGRGIQLAIVSTYGSIMEAVTLDGGQHHSLLGTIEHAASEADAERCAEKAGADEAARTSLLDRLAEAERAKTATHCTEGHELDEENTYHAGGGRKGCRRCRREKNYWWQKQHRNEVRR